MSLGSQPADLHGGRTIPVTGALNRIGNRDHVVPVPTVAVGTPRPGATAQPGAAVLPTATGPQPIVVGDDPCTPFRTGPAGPSASAPTPSPAQLAGGSPNPASPQPARPPVDLN